MFDETLLDSSPSRVSVLKGKHWLISLGARGGGVSRSVFRFAVCCHSELTPKW